jgi:hypothetical protein
MTRSRLLLAATVLMLGATLVGQPGFLFAQASTTMLVCDNTKSCEKNSDCDDCVCFPNPLGPHCYQMAEQ